MPTLLSIVSFTLTLGDGELAAPEHRAVLLVEGQIVDGDGHIYQQLLALLHGPQLWDTHRTTSRTTTGSA